MLWFKCHIFVLSINNKTKEMANSNIIESVTSNGQGSYFVTITYRNKELTGTSNNSIAYDRIKNTDLSEKAQGHYGMTDKQARQAFRNDVLRQNKIA